MLMRYWAFPPFVAEIKQKYPNIKSERSKTHKLNLSVCVTWENTVSLLILLSDLFIVLVLKMTYLISGSIMLEAVVDWKHRKALR